MRLPERAEEGGGLCGFDGWWCLVLDAAAADEGVADEVRLEAETEAERGNEWSRHCGRLLNLLVSERRDTDEMEVSMETSMHHCS